MNKSIIKKFLLMLYFIMILLSMSSKSLMFLWMMMEINTMLFIPLNSKMSHSMSNSMFKYFVIQALTSSVMIFSLVLNLNILNYKILNIMILLMIWTKLGMFPFSTWYFQISENMKWKIWFLLNTFQKLIPLWILSWKIMNMELLNYLMMMNMSYCMMEIWSQNSLRWMINCSSLNHLNWMIISFNNNNNYWEYYFLFYLIMNYILLKFMKNNNWNILLNFFNNKSLMLNLLFSLMIMNFMGVPPFFNFFMKMMIIMNTKTPLLMFLMTIMNIIIMIIYFYFIIPLMSKFLNNKIKKISNNLFLAMLTSVSIFFSLIILMI